MIIDCHTHAYPAEVVARPRAWALEHNEPHWAELVDPTDRTSIQGWSDPDSMLAAMDAADVDRAALLGWYWENESTCRWHNAAMAEWIRHAPDRFIGFAAIHPSADVREQLESSKAMGFSGVGELHLAVQGWDLDSADWQHLTDWCTRENWPINFHVTEAAGIPQPGSVATPLEWFIRIAQRAPDLKIILAHWGGGLPFFTQNPRLRPYLHNVYYDTAASPLLYEPSIFRSVIDLVGAKHVVFGSDYPLRIYPREQTSPDMQRYVHAIHDEAQLSLAETEAVMGENFARLLPPEQHK
ncbi:MAG: amidohydrolase family protein [Verrucomicrobia bacterium]|jgi:predicted TIM-barrel fold metal-dependent hydrolase|nr:amidohydrolase family protein [Verrucomicrobiota bacterium]